jgi:diguanylate cyclase (GGDEF)-like protein
VSENQALPSISPLTDKDPIRLLTGGYILALAIIGILSISIHMIIDRIVAEQDSVATIIGKSAEQATLAQSVVLYATAYVHERTEEARDRLVQTSTDMRKMHNALIAQRSGEKNNAASKALLHIYFQPPYKLNSRINGFLDHADTLARKEISGLSAQDPDYIYLKKQIEGGLGGILTASLASYEDAIISKINKLQAFQRMAIFAIIATLICEAYFIFMPLVSRVRRYAEELKKITMTDLLTGIGNRRFFILRGSQELQRARRLKKDMCLALIDLDRFKSINDGYGHRSGDMVLQQFAQVAQRCIRKEDVFARLGGEEFAVLLPHTAVDDGMNVIERLRRCVEETQFDLDRPGSKTGMTISAGLTRVNLAQDDFETAIVMADIALYDAKRAGRNRVVYKEADNFFEVGKMADSAP